MTDTEASGDRRVALRLRHYEDIVAAAIALMEQVGTDFTVDQLAERAGISRRTVFNHFTTLDDVLAVAGAKVIGDVIDGLLVPPVVAGAAPNLRAVHEELFAAVRSADLVAPLVHLSRVLGGDTDEPWRAALMQRTIARVIASMSATFEQRHPGLDRLDIDLLVSAVVNGIVVLHAHWVQATGAVDSDASRQLWSELVERLFTLVPQPQHR